MIVEDEESLADPLAFLLRKEGFEATVVTDGPSALAEFERAGADIVLTYWAADVAGWLA